MNREKEIETLSRIATLNVYGVVGLSALSEKLRRELFCDDREEIELMYNEEKDILYIRKIIEGKILSLLLITREDGILCLTDISEDSIE